MLRRVPFYYGWIILIAGGLALFTSAPGQTYVVSVFIDPMIEDLGWSRNLYSSLYTGGSLTAALAVPFIGRLLDRFGGRIMLTAVAMAFGVATVLIGSVASPIHLFLGFVAIRALGQGSLQLISTTLVAMWFIRRRGRAMALMALASPMSQAAFPVVAFFLISTWGWRNAWVILGAIIWIVLIPVGIILVRRSPESVGLEPDGVSRPMGSPSAAANISADHNDWTLGEAIRTRTFWMLLFVGLPLSMIGTGLTFHHVDLFVTKGYDVGLAAGVLSFMAPMALLGTIVAGFLNDKLPNRHIMASGHLLLATTMVWAMPMSLVWQAFVYGGSMGFAQGVIMTTTNVIWPNYFGRTHIGSIRGVVSTAMVASSAMGPLPVSFLFALNNDYNTPILAFLGLPIATAVVSLLAVPPRKSTAAVRPEVEPVG
ncbi:MAG: MFS transporter [SAR202 cluster bacterium]|nr:MFS transporter [SAR202 cluster bacterium]MDP6714315.1 MFS transporter [SAR202 cluster bacterium]